MITIRKFEESDWPLLKEIRLKALKSDPGVFGSNYAAESVMTDDEWISWLINPDAVSFGVFDENKIIGMTGIAIHRDDPTRKTAILWGSWLEPEYRGKGISEKMYKARIEWAKEHPACEKIVVSHRASNIASKYANQKHGFIYTHTTHKEWPDGTHDDDVHYELSVKP
jgi:RimJ/RimL family protein N-acetyltransferase